MNPYLVAKEILAKKAEEGVTITQAELDIIDEILIGCRYNPLQLPVVKETKTQDKKTKTVKRTYKKKEKEEE